MNRYWHPAMSRKRQNTNRFVVSYWHIPNSTDYADATVIEVFFDNETDATNFAKQVGDMPPEMATVTNLVKYDEWRSRGCTSV